jgi:hypothetical protein
MRWLWGAVVAAGALWSMPVQAAGSLGLDEVLKAVGAAPKLVTEIEVALKRAGLKVGDVTCTGARHGNQWKHLGGRRAAPYECEIGDRGLRIDADRIYYDARAKRLGELGRASDRALFTKAWSFRETNFRWRWSP